MPEHDILKILSESPVLQVRRGRRPEGQTVILKHLAANAGPHAYALLRRIDLPGIVRPLGLMGTDGGPERELEDIGGESLERVLGPREKLAYYYSLGATFHRRLTGRPPFEAGDVLGSAHEHRTATLPPEKLDCAIRPGTLPNRNEAAGLDGRGPLPG
jgi:hypothetical protein